VAVRVTDETDRAPPPLVQADDEACETCGEVATHYDYDQHKHFCVRCIEQPGFTVPL